MPWQLLRWSPGLALLKSKSCPCGEPYLSQPSLSLTNPHSAPLNCISDVKEKIWRLLPARDCCLISIPCNLKLDDIARKMFIPRKAVYLATGPNFAATTLGNLIQPAQEGEEKEGCLGKWTTQTAECITTPKEDSGPLFNTYKSPYPTHSSMQWSFHSKLYHFFSM